MLRQSKFILTMVLAVGLTGMAAAFSLLGPGEAWQTPALGYNPLNSDIGGPHNLGEEYRFNVPTLTYAFDESFLNYFGSAGTAAVHNAIAILNGLPPASQMSSNLTEFPNDAKRINYQANALNLLDLKTAVLGALVEHMGVASPERWVWSLRDRRTFTVGGQTFTNYTIIQRNFDPATFSPSRYVNGVLYGYVIGEFQNPTFADAIETTIDPLAFSFTSVASIFGGLFGGGLGTGEFFIGLTRDDVGALRYMLRTNNFQVEGLPNGSVTNATTNVIVDPYAPAGTFLVVTSAPLSQVTRQGIDKVSFIPYPGDSPVGPRPAITNFYTDRYLTNQAGVTVYASQTVQRILTQPDIIFTAEDLGVDTGGNPILFQRTDTTAWQNNNAINGVANLAGPGVIQPPLGGSIVLAFSKVGPYFFNENPFFVDDLNQTGTGVIWGSFDGSTNPPVVFPNGLTIQDLENQVLNP